MTRSAALLALLACVLWCPRVRPGEPAPAPVLQAMKLELDRSMRGLKAKGQPPPYFISYRVTDSRSTLLRAAYGALSVEFNDESRVLDVDVRVGDYQLDSSHRIKGGGGFFGFPMNKRVMVPIEDDLDGLRSVLWRETDKRYKEAVQKLDQVKSDRTLKVEEEDQSGDFSREPAHQHLGRRASLSFDAAGWKDRIRSYSGMFLDYPQIYESEVSLHVLNENKFFVNSEGTQLQHGRSFVRLSLRAQTTAEDGMRLDRYEAFDAATVEGLPSPEEVKKTIHRLAQDVLALRRAPVMEPYTGPAILSGKAAGVFFHEIFGHRIEGHRQKSETDAQTFTKQVGQPILPAIISVLDDPTVQRAEGKDLRGHYLYDDEGMPARRVTVVENGVLKNFLMSRTPQASFDKSNGHGRAQAGFEPVARQGNLIVQGATVTEKKLRELLVEECKKQGKEFGLLFTEVAGGFTFTGRGFPQAFDVRPIMVYRVHVDGRPDQLVRGVELIGTPLTSFSKILALGGKREIFNGTCGAESGGVPVSSVSPGILTGQIEVQKKEKSMDRPPLLPPPGRRSK